MQKNQEIAIIFKRKRDKDGTIMLLPYTIEAGYFDKETNTFICNKGYMYNHIIEGNELGFIYPEDMENYLKLLKIKSTILFKTRLLNVYRKNKYIYTITEEEQAPIILITNKQYSKAKLLLDNYLLTFYKDNFLSLYKKMLKDITPNPENEKEEITKEKEVSPLDLDIKNIYEKLTEIIIGQDEPIKKILTAIWKQYNGFTNKTSRNILISGKTGVGKTEIIRQLSKLLDIPFFKANATSYSATGYVGSSIEDMLLGLLKNAKYNIEKAQKGILVIDEIDKLSDSNTRSQINKKDVQEGLLKLLEDGTFELTEDNTKYTFNTSEMMIIAMGSFSKIDEEKNSIPEKRPIGFNPIETSKKTKSNKQITREEMVKGGMMPELIGRFPIIVTMNELNHDSFVKILLSEHGTLNINKKFLNTKGIKLTIDKTAIDKIASISEKEGLGARNLDTMIEEALSEASFEISINPDVYEELIINEDTIIDNNKYKLIRKK